MPSIDITVSHVRWLLDAADEDTALYVSRHDCIPCIEVDAAAVHRPRERIIATRANLLSWYGEDHPDHIIEEYLPELQRHADKVAAVLLADTSTRPVVGHTAIISTTAEIVRGEYCDVMVSENALHDYWHSDDGPVVIKSLGFGIALRPVAIGVRVDDEDVLAKAESAAAELLPAHRLDRHRTVAAGRCLAQ